MRWRSHAGMAGRTEKSVFAQHGTGATGDARVIGEEVVRVDGLSVQVARVTAGAGASMATGTGAFGAVRVSGVRRVVRVDRVAIGNTVAGVASLTDSAGRQVSFPAGIRRSSGCNLDARQGTPAIAGATRYWNT
jgi:hypothetical protein